MYPLRSKFLFLIFICCSTVSVPTVASVKIQCPCSLTPGTGSTAVFEYGIIFTESTEVQSGLSLSLIHSPTKSPSTATELYDGFYFVGSNDLSDLQFSDSPVRFKSSLELFGSGFDEGFLLAGIQDASGEWLDFLNLTEAPVSWSSDASSIPEEGFEEIDTLTDGDSDGRTDLLERLMGASADEPHLYANTTIEVLFTYGSGAELAESNIETRIAHLVSVSNLSFEFSNLNIEIKSIGSVDLGSDFGQDADDILDGFEERSGIWKDFDSRISRRPDLIVHLSSLDRLGDSVAGLATLQGGLTDGIFDYENLYSTKSNAAVVAIDSGDRTLVHEIGHLMGLSHSARQGSDSGTFFWSRGHGVERQFVTLMGYQSAFGNAKEVSVFSSPYSSCDGSAPCGVSRNDYLAGADAVNSLSISAPQIAAISNGFSPYFLDSSGIGVISVDSVDDIGLAGIGAFDTEDGELTNSITSSVVETDELPDQYNHLQTLSVTDSHGNRSSVTRKLLLDSDSDGVGDNTDAFPNDAFESVDTDSDGIGNNADTDDDGDSFSDEQEAIDGTDPLSPFSCRYGCFSFDVDQSSSLNALTDGLLVMRHLFDFSGDTLVANATETSAIRSTASDISSYLTDAQTELDIDGSGEVGALTDGLLLIRYLFDFRGESLISNAVDANATRKTAAEIEAYIEARVPGS